MLLHSVVTMTDRVVDSADSATFGAITVFGFLIGLLVVVLIAKVFKKRRDSKKKVSIVDQQLLSDSDKGTLPSKAL